MSKLRLKRLANKPQITKPEIGRAGRPKTRKPVSGFSVTCHGLMLHPLVDGGKLRTWDLGHHPDPGPSKLPLLISIQVRYSSFWSEKYRDPGGVTQKFLL